MVDYTIKKNFGGKPFEGKVHAVIRDRSRRGGASSSILFHVEYEDGDVEDIEVPELNQLLQAGSATPPLQGSAQSVAAGQAGAQDPPALNVQAMLKPFVLDTRKCPVRDARKRGRGNNNNVSDEFEKGRCTTEVSYEIEYASMHDPASGRAADARGVIFLEDAWMSFGDGVPDNDMHIASRDMDRSSEGLLLLPPTRLLMVRDLLERCGKAAVDEDEYVGRYL